MFNLTPLVYIKSFTDLWLTEINYVPSLKHRQSGRGLCPILCQKSDQDVWKPHVEKLEDLPNEISSLHVVLFAVRGSFSEEVE